MKKILVLLMVLLSTSIMAGDLTVVCYLNDDEGDYLELMGPFMDTNTISMDFDYNNYHYDVAVTRDSMFENYEYTVTKTDTTNNSQSVIVLASPDFGYSVNVDEDVSCIVGD